MTRKPDGKPAKTERVTFTRPAAERIAKVVREVEAGNRDLGPVSFGSAPGAVGSKTFRLATLTSAWNVNTEATLTLRGVTTTPNTVRATNLFCGISPASPCEVSIAKDGTAWYLVQANLTKLPGYSNSVAVMAVSGGYLRFIGTTSC